MKTVHVELPYETRKLRGLFRVGHRVAGVRATLTHVAVLEMRSKDSAAKFASI